MQWLTQGQWVPWCGCPRFERVWGVLEVVWSVAGGPSAGAGLRNAWGGKETCGHAVAVRSYELLSYHLMHEKGLYWSTNRSIVESNYLGLKPH